jgi:hypothetical protein
MSDECEARCELAHGEDEFWPTGFVRPPLSGILDNPETDQFVSSARNWSWVSRSICRAEMCFQLSRLHASRPF